MSRSHWLVILYFSLLSAIPQIITFQYEHVREETILFTILWSFIILFVIEAFKNKKIPYWGFGIPLIVLNLIDLGHIILYQGRITRNTFFILFDTNIREATDFIIDQFSISRFLVLISYLLFAILVGRKILTLIEAEIKSLKQKKYFLSAILLPLILHIAVKNFNFINAAEAYVNSAPFLYVSSQYVSYNEEIEKFNKYFNELKQLPAAHLKSESFKNRVHLLIIGESTTRTRMGLYGYFRDTNPELKKIQNDLIVFNDSWCSNPPSTYWNLKKINSFLNESSPKDFKINTHLVNIMNAVGFKTYWLSNQITTGVANNFTTAMAMNATVHTFVNATDASSYDEKLFSYLEKALNEPAPEKFIVIHLLGTHMVYSERYPNEFSYFKTTDDIPKKPFHNDDKLKRYNQYDNAVRYNDWVMSQIIQIAQNKNVDTLIYLSDHGEEAYMDADYHGHPSSAKNENLFKIPFIIWNGSQFMKKYSDQLDSQKNKTFVSDDLIHTLIDLYGIEIKDYDPSRSLLSPKFKPKNRPI